MHWIDPASLPQTEGILTQWILSPHGELEGLVLNAADQVHFPPHLSKKISKLFDLGDTVRVRGLKPRGAEMIVALSLSNVEGKEIVDHGPEHEKHTPSEAKRKPLEIAGVVSLALRGPRGELRGALLEDGTSLWAPPHAADALIEYFKPGAPIRAWGNGLKNKKGRAMDVDSIAHDIAPEDAANPGAAIKNPAPQKVLAAAKKHGAKFANQKTTPATRAMANTRSPSAVGGLTQTKSAETAKPGAENKSSASAKAVSPEVIAKNTIHSVNSPSEPSKKTQRGKTAKKEALSSDSSEIIAPKNSKPAAKRALAAKPTPALRKTAQ